MNVLKHCVNTACVVTSVVLALGGVLILRVPVPRPNLVFQNSDHQTLGEAKLISIEPLSTPGELCDWRPVSASTGWRFSEAPTPGEPTSSAKPDANKPGAIVDRAPKRIIRDSYPTYSAVGVDTISDEVILQDENLFGLKVFNRLDNTPPHASFTEPKRVIAGKSTELEFNCGIYVDPKSGDIYSVNNDTMNMMVVFPKNAKGDVAPARELVTPHRTYGIAVDEHSQELYLTVEHPPQVVVYRKSARGNEKPIRVIEGSKTGLADPHGIALDTEKGLLFVANHGNYSDSQVAGSGRFEPPSITVYPLNATGDVQPTRVIQGSQTQLDWPAAMYLDEQRGDLYVANDMRDSILIFPETAAGNTAPSRAIQGPHTSLKNPTGVFVDTKNHEVWASNFGNHSATVYNLEANGDAKPLRIIRSGPANMQALGIGNPGAVAYDSKRNEVLVPN